MATIEFWLTLSLVLNVLFFAKWLNNKLDAKSHYELDELQSGDKIVIDLDGKTKTASVLKNEPNLQLITLRENDSRGAFVYKASYKDDIFQQRSI